MLLACLIDAGLDIRVDAIAFGAGQDIAEDALLVFVDHGVAQGQGQQFFELCKVEATVVAEHVDGSDGDFVVAREFRHGLSLGKAG